MEYSLIIEVLPKKNYFFKIIMEMAVLFDIYQNESILQKYIELTSFLRENKNSASN